MEPPNESVKVSMMWWIQNMVEPKKLTLAWQKMTKRTDSNVSLILLP